jgi:hypothetical protein
VSESEWIGVIKQRIVLAVVINVDDIRLGLISSEVDSLIVVRLCLE